MLIRDERPREDFRLPDDATALVATDAAGWELLARARRRRRRIPDDLAAVAYNDDGRGERYDPQVTVVDAPRAALGERAAALVIDLIEGGQEVARQQAVAPRLVARRSCGCQPDRTSPPGPSPSTTAAPGTGGAQAQVTG